MVGFGGLTLYLGGGARGRRHEGGVVLVGHQRAVLAVADQPAGGGVVERDHGQAAGHGLGGDVAEGLGDAGEQEQVGRRVVRGEVGAAALAREDGVGAAQLQLLAQRAVAHQHQAGARLLAPDGLEGGEQRLQVLLGREAAHAGDDQVVGAGAPLRAQRVAAVRGVEAAHVHAARHLRQVAEALGLQVVEQRLRGHHRALRRVVEAAQVGHDGPAQEAEAVVLAVGVEVGAEVGAHRQAQRLGGQQRRAAERALGGDVHHVRTLLAPQPHQRSLARQAHAQAGVVGNGNAAHQHVALRVAGRGGRVVGGLARPHHLHEVVALAQALHQAGDGHGHAVDLGRIGLRHAGDSQGSVADVFSHGRRLRIVASCR